MLDINAQGMVHINLQILSIEIRRDRFMLDSIYKYHRQHLCKFHNKMDIQQNKLMI